MTPICRLDSLPDDKRAAFIALLTGAKLDHKVFRNPEGLETRPWFKKSDCDTIPAWRAFYQVELSDLGLITFVESPSLPDATMEGWTFTEIKIRATSEGREALEAFYERMSRPVRIVKVRTR